MKKGPMILTRKDLLAASGEEEDRDASVGPQSPEHSKMFDFGEEVLTIYWGGFQYQIALVQLDTPAKVMSWILHLTEKDWEHTTPRRIHGLLQAIYARNGWEREF